MRIPLLIALASAPAFGGVVFSQPVVDDPAAVGRGWFSHASPRPTRNYKHADDFALTSDARIDSVRWWGLSEGRFRADLGNFSAFTIEFFSVRDGLPDGLLASTTLDLAATEPTMTGRTSHTNGAIEHVHQATLASPVSLAAGTNYFIAISAHSVNVNRDGWMWSDADGADEYSATYAWSAGVWTGYIDTNSAFELISVPSPASGFLLIASALVRRWHRR